MSVWGLFNDEGMVEGDFYSVEEAQKAIADRYTPDDELVVEEICPEHPEHAKEGCEECNSDDQTFTVWRRKRLKDPLEEWDTFDCLEGATDMANELIDTCGYCYAEVRNVDDGVEFFVQRAKRKRET